MATVPSGWVDRFSSKVNIGAPNECWLWTAVQIPNGYGQFWFRGRMINAHRAALVLMGVVIPPGHVVMHECDNRLCCNPNHLAPAVQALNILDAQNKGRNTKGESHGMVILTETSVRDILLRNCTSTVAARKYGVSRACIHDIRQGRSWRHLTTRGSH